MQEGNDMKKRIITTGLIALLLTGCAGGAELSETEHDRVAQYAANLVLKYDSNYKERLLSESEIKEAKEKLRIAAEKEAELQALLASKNQETKKEQEEVADAESATGEGSEEQEVAIKHVLQDVLNMEGFEICSGGYSVVDEYPENIDEQEAMAVDVRATAGKKLVIMKYSITNNSGNNLECDLFSKDISSEITVNGSVKAEAMLTMLLNDFGTLKTEIEAGATYEAVQVFEIPESAAAIQQLELNMSLGSEKFAIQL